MHADGCKASRGMGSRFPLSSSDFNLSWRRRRLPDLGGELNVSARLFPQNLPQLALMSASDPFPPIAEIGLRSAFHPLRTFRPAVRRSDLQ
jgi:hypothetical protein